MEEIIEDEEQVNDELLCVFVVMNALMGCILFGLELLGSLIVIYLILKKIEK